MNGYFVIPYTPESEWTSPKGGVISKGKAQLFQPLNF